MACRYVSYESEFDVCSGHGQFHLGMTTILGCGYVLVTVQVVYDQAVFMSESEYYAPTGKVSSNLQQLIEEPELYLVARLPHLQQTSLELFLPG